MFPYENAHAFLSYHFVRLGFREVFVSHIALNFTCPRVESAEPDQKQKFCWCLYSVGFTLLLQENGESLLIKRTREQHWLGSYDACP